MAALLAMGLAGAAAAAGTNIQVSLLPAAERMPAGETAPLAIVMKPKPGWHGYWKNPGDAGTEAAIEWDLPKGVTAGPLRYPVPDRLIVSGLMNYVYEHDYALLADLRLSKDIAPGTMLPIRARLDYLACTREICVPEKAEIEARVVAGAAGEALVWDARFEAFEAAMPRPLGSEGRFEVKGGRLRIAIPLPAATAVADPYFFPLADGVLDYAAPQQVSRNGDALIVETAAGDGAATGKIEGLLKIGDGQGLLLAAAPGAVPAAGTAVNGESEAAQAGGAGTILVALLGAFVGGLLLNIMPCVFPILSLKALSLAKASESGGAARREAWAYTAGAVLVCLALGGIILGLRAGGAAAGWAFQLQDPRVILVLLLLVTAIALNLAGLFELPAVVAGDRLTRAGGSLGAFWTGALAAFIATPCTGPFMGAALGAALVLPPAAALAVFGGLGLGLAFPFLLLGLVPALRHRLPRPGAWMTALRKLLSLPMFATAFGLLWILGRQTGVDGMTIGIGAALVLGLGLWWAANRRRKGYALLALLPAALAAFAALLYIPASAAPAEAKAKGVLGAEPFSEARLAALRQQGRPVFVYFTADWCLTCKANEKAALDRNEVANAFAAKNITVLVGDWTRGDPNIGRFLEKHGRSGVPLYLYYAPGKEAEILPQVLTVGRLTAL